MPASFWSGPLFLLHPRSGPSKPINPRYLLYRVLEPLGPYIVGTWRARETHKPLNPKACAISTQSVGRCSQTRACVRKIQARNAGTRQSKSSNPKSNPNPDESVHHGQNLSFLSWMSAKSIFRLGTRQHCSSSRYDAPHPHPCTQNHQTPNSKP